MKTLLALRHVAFEDLGAFAPALEARGYAIEYLEPGLQPLSARDPQAPDLLVILGGPISVYENALYPFLNGEIDFIRDRLQAGKPTLGICLGAQLIACALGARVYPGPAVEIGWTPLSLTDAGAQSPVRHLDAALTDMLHWHGDTFDLPPGAELLASTPACRHQIYRRGPECLAFQCHPEADGDRIESWLVGHACELGKHRIDIPALREQSRARAAALRRQGRLCLEEWLDGLPA